ncbi:hypothetical protein ONS96_013311 [Cadophora gregata f. sp. sojae]|nr:hypothetical protein ONS96_013311 [Cadophora gregata f. sp. sojae]
MSMFKNVTGSDIVKVGEFSSKAVCSMIIATNGLPDVVRDPEFMSDALSRRMICVKMDVDTAEAVFEPDPSDPVVKMDFLCSCLYIRMNVGDRGTRGKRKHATRKGSSRLIIGFARDDTYETCR